MNVTERNRQISTSSAYESYGLRESRQASNSKARTAANASKSVSNTDRYDPSNPTAAGPGSLSASDQSSPAFKVKSSGPSNSVGELAGMLSRAETIMDVQQVMSKAMRALADLKMGAIASEGKEAKKYAQQIKRMEKLIKRIQKKLKHLSKEERMEDRRKKALKHAEEQKAQQIEKELQARRKKRRREEQRYALREMAEDRKTSTNELMSSMSEALSGALSPDISGLTGIGDLTSDTADFSGMEAISVDISV